MELNLFQNISEELKKVNINEFIKEILERLNKMEEELVIDRYEANVAVCENRKTGEMREIPKEDIQEGLKEGDIIKLENGKYVQKVEEQKETEQRIKDKMDKLWN